MKLLNAWKKCLESVLIFPFDAGQPSEDMSLRRLFLFCQKIIYLPKILFYRNIFIHSLYK